MQVIADTLTQKYHLKTIAIDLPGSGKRPELDDKTVDDYVKWLRSYIKKLDLSQPPIIAGHSMGSIIVSHFIEKYPDMVDDRVILLSPIFRTPFGVAFNKVSCFIMTSILRLIPKRYRHGFLASKFVSFCISHYLTIDKSRQKKIDKLHYEYSGRFASAESLLADIKISMNYQTKIPADKTILFIRGDKDRLSPLKEAKKRIAGTGNTLRVLKGVGHLINYERPKTVAGIISEFIDRTN